MGFFSRDSVRICALFGLRLALCPWFCPYYHSFRTLHGSGPAVLSLLPLFSDSARLCARGSVPITTSIRTHARLWARGSVPITTLFGLNATLCPRFCPITTLFGLCTVLCPQFCLYYHSFRTLHGSGPAVLSLLPLYSDSARLCARGSVLIPPPFGLRIVLCPQFCPYYPSIRTQRSSVLAVLSESEPYLDSVELFSLKHCLNQTNLLNKRLFSWIFHSQVLFTFFKRDTNGHFGSIILAIRIGAVRRITFRVIFIILIVVDK